MIFFGMFEMFLCHFTVIISPLSVIVPVLNISLVLFYILQFNKLTASNIFSSKILLLFTLTDSR